MKCPECGADAKGKFCSSCGAALQQKVCSSCGAPVKANARFCDQCGKAVQEASAAAASDNANLGWWAAGVMLLILIMVLGYPILTRSESGPPAGTTAPPTSTTGVLDLSQMTPRQAADRLFDRVMRSMSAGDTADALSFIPMAIDAYELLQPLDADGAFHLALLNARAQLHEASLAAAAEALERFPDNLLLLSAAGDAAVALGDETTAEGYYRRVLEVYDVEVVKPLMEYQAHQVLLPGIRETAQTFLGGR